MHVSLKVVRGATLLAAAAAIAAPAGLFAQGISPNGTVLQGGTGLGSVNTVLTVQSPGNTTTESGCVSPTGTTTCGFADVGVQQGQTQTVFLSALAGLTGSNLGIILNFAEPTTAISGTLNSLVLQLYNNVGTSLFTAALAGPIDFPNTFVGTGNAGFLFQLTPATATAFNTAVAAGATQLGLGASLSNVTGGQETFFVTTTATSITATPEPGTIALFATGLAGLVPVAIRRRKRSTQE